MDACTEHFHLEEQEIAAFSTSWSTLARLDLPKKEKKAGVLTDKKWSLRAAESLLLPLKLNATCNATLCHETAPVTLPETNPPLTPFIPFMELRSFFSYS
jgi:hypothetical protein